MRRLFLAAFALGSAVAVVSAFVPLSVDEASWLAVERKMALGRELYVDVIDNKAPPVFFLVRGLDLLPGPFEPVRGVLVGLLAALLALVTFDVADRCGIGRRRALIAGAAVALGACVASALSLTIEMVAIAFVMAGVAFAARDRPILSATASLGIAFDPRAIVLLPGVALVAASRSWRGARTSLLAMGLVAGALAASLVHPDLRFGLIELNLASRGASWSAGELGISAARALILPIVAVFAAWNIEGVQQQRPGPRAALVGLVFGVPAVAVVVASLLPFDKYWVLLLPAVPFVIGVRAAAARASAAVPLVIGLLVLALAPGAIQTVRVARDRASRLDAYRRVASILEDRLPEGATFVQFDANPFLVAELPESASDPSPLLGLLALPTSRQDAFVSRIRSALGNADAVVDDGGLEASPEDVSTSLRPIRDLFVASLDAFPCSARVEHITVRFRPHLCPSTEGTS